MIPKFLLPIPLLLAFTACAQDYTIGPDSQRQPSVPAGKVTKYSWNASKLFPGTERDYWIYVPAQYKGDKPACLMVFQDGGGMIGETAGYRVPIVLDNLIHRDEMPVTIGLFINPGVLPALSPGQQPRYNRSHEYDALGDRYARFLIDEILPEISKQYNLSKNPDDRAIGGSSSGAIAAFTAAWTHPEAFHRVLSFIGSYTNLKGGDIYADLIRKTEPKPLRVFLQDGKNDLSIYSGSWYMANQALSFSLEYAGYDSKFVVGTEGHNGKHGSAILPDALRWLWRDYPQPIKASIGGGKERQFVTDILDPGKGWELVSQGHKFTEGPAVDREGNVYFTDIPNNRIHRAGIDGKVTIFKEDTGGANGLMFGPDGRLYAAQNGRKRIVAYTMDGKETVIAEGFGSNDLAVGKQGQIYVTDPEQKSVWYIDPQGHKRVVNKDLTFPNGVRFSPDQALLMVADMREKWIWSFRIEPDGSLSNGEPFYRMETPDESSASGADGMTLDTEGHLYVATKTGIQICDQPGRVVAILSKPDESAWLSNVVFGGPNFDYLYGTNGTKVYRRHLRRKGVRPGDVVQLPKPGL